MAWMLKVHRQWLTSSNKTTPLHSFQTGLPTGHQAFKHVNYGSHSHSDDHHLHLYPASNHLAPTNCIEEQSQTHLVLSWSKFHIYLSRLSSSKVISIKVFSFLFTDAATSFTFALTCLSVRRLHWKGKRSQHQYTYTYSAVYMGSVLWFLFILQVNPGWLQDNYAFHRDAMRVDLLWVRMQLPERKESRHKSHSSTAYITDRCSAPNILSYTSSWCLSFAPQNAKCSMHLNEGKTLR